MRKNIVIIFAMLLLFFSCHKDIKNVTIQGTISEAESKKPMDGVEVTIICWKYSNSPDASYTEKEVKVVKTDSEGKYKVNFDKGARIDVEVTLGGYIDAHKARQLYSRRNTINIALKKQ